MHIGAIVAECFSFRTAIIESNRVRGKQSWVSFVRTAKQPELLVILLEDLGPCLGLVFALIGVSLTLSRQRNRGGEPADCTFPRDQAVSGFLRSSRPLATAMASPNTASTAPTSAGATKPQPQAMTTPPRKAPRALATFSAA